MGFFSWNCKSCGHPLICQAAVNSGGVNAWMTQGVALLPGGSVIMGEYDGYGSLGCREIWDACNNEPACYHRACWELAGKPVSYDTPSESARDQGWFFADHDHAVPDPRLLQSTKTGGVR